MRTYISLLRGINVSGQKKILMKDLQALYESLHLRDVKTYIQSGNVIFTSSIKDISKLTLSIENAIKISYGFSVEVFINTPQDFSHVIENNPYVKATNENINRLYVTFLSEKPDRQAVKNLDNVQIGNDEFTLINKEIYLCCNSGYSKSKLSNTFFEKKIGIPATTRNWKTVNKLYEMVN